MKKYLSMFLAVILLISGAIPIMTSFALNGIGDAEKPYIISNKEDLLYVTE